MATSPSTVSLDPRGKRIHSNVDWISTLPNDLLLIILMKMITERAVQTSVLSTRWESVWKHMPSLIFDMRRIVLTREEFLAGRLEYISSLITKVINNHNGNLENCRSHSLVYNSEDCVLQTWIRSLIHVKGTKSLEIFNHLVHREASILHLLPNTFAHPALTSLHLYHFYFETPHAFNNCHNLLILKLGRICAEIGVFNTIIAACPSLKVLVLEYTRRDSQIGCLKIHNNNLKILHVALSYFDCFDVSAPLLDIFSIRATFVTRDMFILAAPRLLKVNTNYWAQKSILAAAHISYNISCNAQEKESIEHKYLVSRDSNYLERFQSLAVIVDLMNPREVEMLREVLVAWNGTMKELEIVFKHNNNPREEGESSSIIDGTQKEKWEEAKTFPNANFRVKVLWMFNFNGSDIKQFELASRFVTQGTVMKKMMIKTSSVVPASKKLEIEVAVAKLMELPKGNEKLSIECF